AKNSGGVSKRLNDSCSAHHRLRLGLSPPSLHFVFIALSIAGRNSKTVLTTPEREQRREATRCDQAGLPGRAWRAEETARVSSHIWFIYWRSPMGEYEEHESSQDPLHILRHSTAHLLAAAVTELYPDAKYG